MENSVENSLFYLKDVLNYGIVIKYFYEITFKERLLEGKGRIKINPIIWVGALCLTIWLQKNWPSSNRR